MKSILYLIAMSFCLCIACNDEPVFPDPGLDTSKDVRDTVRRDTIDTYFLEMQVKTGNGVKSIEILNGLNYQLIEEVNQYNGQKDFLFRYPIELSQINSERDTTLHYIVKVIDNDNRSYNKAFALTVKPFSAPTITISGVDGTLGLVSPVFQLNALFETGLNTIRSYVITFEGEVLDEQIISDDISEYEYSNVFSLDLEKERDYVLSISLTDSQGTIKEENIILRLIDLQRPIQVVVNKYSAGTPRLDRTLDFHYNQSDSEQLDSICGVTFTTTMTGIVTTPYTLCFHYNEHKQVVKLEEWRTDDEDARSLYNTYTYDYNSNGQLESVKGDVEEYCVECTEWYEDNRVKRWAFAKDMPVTNETAWQYTPAGEPLMADLWIISGKRSLGTSFSSVVIPTYLPSLPPFLPCRTGLTYEEIQTLLMRQCGVTTVHNYDNNWGLNFEDYLQSDPKVQYSYSTNINGRLEKIIKRTISFGKWTIDKEYLFIYKD